MFSLGLRTHRKTEYIIVCFSFRLFKCYGLFRVAFRIFSGGFRPPPATLAMVAGGGGRMFDHMSLLELNFASRKR